MKTGRDRDREEEGKWERRAEEAESEGLKLMQTHCRETQRNGKRDRY